MPDWETATKTTQVRGRGRRARSPTVPVGDQTDDDVLELRRSVWENRPLTREVYRRYFVAVAAELTPGAVTVEIGGGTGHFKEFDPSVLVSDIVSTGCLDFAADAMHLPVRSESVDNLVMFDMLHHLPSPARFFREAVRVLRIGGRIVMLEPYISPFSRLVFKLAHPEPVDSRADPLPPNDEPVFECTGPFASNQAIPTTLFFRDLHRFQERFPELRLRTRRRESVLAYPLSGGFSGPCLVPRFAHRWIWGVERMFSPLRRWMAFRLLVALERV